MDTKRLEWDRGGEWFIRSRCGFYVVAKGMVGGTARYIPYLAGDHKKMRRAEIIGEASGTASEAMALCERHANDNERDGKT